jgi:hypothetical protein
MAIARNLNFPRIYDLENTDIIRLHETHQGINQHNKFWSISISSSYHN